MAEIAFSLEAAPTLGGLNVKIGGNYIAEQKELALVSIAIPLGGERKLSDTLNKAFGLPRPKPTMSVTKKEMRLLSTAPDQFLLVFPHNTPDAEAVIQEKLGGAGYTTDQTDVWAVLEISGPDTNAALERLCPVDAPAMPVNGSARTVMEHMGAMIVRTGPETFLLLSASSSARSFLHAVETSFWNCQ